MQILRLILGDQLNQAHSWYEEPNGDTLYVLMEMRQETDYVKHHIQKVVGFFAAMRAQAKYLEGRGFGVKYIKINDSNNLQSLTKNLQAIIEQEKIQHFEYQYPDEYRLDQQLKDFCKQLSISTKAVSSEHFLTNRLELKRHFEGKKTYLMESFYRMMRKKHKVMIEGNNEPQGGKWNFDASNRKKWKGQPAISSAKNIESDQSAILKEIEASGCEYFGNVDAAKYIWPTTREQSVAALGFFVTKCLPHFGDYQDAMVSDQWSMFHSRLSFAINVKLLHPKEVIDAVVEKWEGDKEAIDISQVEGFVRQILGWREYMRGVYWAEMPSYSTKNFLNNRRKLPSWFWTGETKMECLKQSITQSLDYAYAHHIQRLMITGAWTLMTGVDPDEVDEWYLGIYIDAIEWVEITNTRGMSQFADGGIVGTKPYLGSSSYIHKMSNYCDNCQYNRKTKTDEDSCPWNTLYWNFYDRNRDKLEKNARIGMAYRTWDKMDPSKRTAYLERAEKLLDRMEEL